jgi:DNA-binding MurR/RpiR family transcriptional regulator
VGETFPGGEPLTPGWVMEVDNMLVLAPSEYEQLSPKQQRIARFVAENPSVAAFSTVSELAVQAGTSAATVVRFAQALGFSGYDEFQQNIRHGYLRTLRPLETLAVRSNASANAFEAQLMQDIDNLRMTLGSLHIDELQAVVARIARAHHILIISSGSYSSVGVVLGHLLGYMGYHANCEDRGGAQITAALTPLTPDDLLIGVSFWKGVRETTRALQWASQRGIPTVAITDTVYSPLARHATHRLVFPTESTSFFQSMVAPLSIVYGLIAELARTADAEHARRMAEAEETLEQLEVSSVD